MTRLQAGRTRNWVSIRGNGKEILYSPKCPAQLRSPLSLVGEHCRAFGSRGMKVTSSGLRMCGAYASLAWCTDNFN